MYCVSAIPLWVSAIYELYELTVVGRSVCPSVCLFGDISLLEPSIAPQTILRIQRSIKVGKNVGFFLKLLRFGRNVKAASEVGMITVRVRETEKALIKLETLLGIKLTAETGKSSRQLSKL